MHMFTSTISENRQTENVIAETSAGDPAHTIVVGAHLDSVLAGPGINDNGSGSGTLLEIAETYARPDRVPRNRVRFMWYGAEETARSGRSSMSGVSARMSSTTSSSCSTSTCSDRRTTSGSSTTGTTLRSRPAWTAFRKDRAGSARIERLFLDYFEAVFGTASFIGSDPTPFNGRSDYGAFILEGIPAGGPLLRCRGSKTAARGAPLRGDVGPRVRPLLPPGLRHLRRHGRWHFTWTRSDVPGPALGRGRAHIPPALETELRHAPAGGSCRGGKHGR